MHVIHPAWPVVSRFLPVALLITALACPAFARAQATVGFRGHFDGVSLDGWLSGSVLANPGTGGFGGANDGYLQAAVLGPLPFNLGAFGQVPEYSGDWTAAGITQVRLWLNDVGSDDDLELHFGVGNGLAGNFWQCNTGFIPPHGEWVRRPLRSA